MRILVIGGGKIGSFLARELVAADHAVTVVEPVETRAQELADDIDAVVLHGDGTSVPVLEAADIHRTDWLLAVSGLDEVNLVACQLARTKGVEHVLARLNNPLNRRTFDALGIPVVGVTDLIVDVIAREIKIPELDRIAVVGRGNLSLCEYEIPDDFPPARLRDLSLPPQSVIAVVLRGGDAVVPGADTELHPGDHITAITAVDQESALEAVFATDGR